MNIIDLFSGAGGLTEGFRSNYNIIGHIEMESPATQTLKVRDAYYYLKQHNNEKKYLDFLSGKITESELFSAIPKNILDRTINEQISDESLNDLFQKLDYALDHEPVTGIIGGPPCQAYSTIGRARNASKKASDGRIYLYRYYIDFLKRYKPRFFVFENVRGLLSFKDVDGELLFPKMQKEFRVAGYELDYRIIDAANYGTPQSRKRIIIFGVVRGEENKITSFFRNLERFKTSTVTVRDAFADLPKLSAGESKNDYDRSATEFIRKNYRKDAAIPLTQNFSRPNNSNDLAIYKKVAIAKLRGVNLRYNELDTKLIKHTHTDKFLDRFKALAWDKPAHTVVAHIAKDGHHYIHPDPDQNRSITVREAARLQGFPDDFYFETSRTSAFKQIGNAVPPTLSERLAKAIKLTFTE